MTTLTDLEADNSELRRKLDICVRWMKRQVEEDIHRISKRKVVNMTVGLREEFMRENQEENMSTRIRGYFWELLLMNAPRQTVEHLTSAEIAFFHLERTKSGDGVGVIGSYNKILDLFIETFIVAQFRKFAIKKWATILRTNDPLEKALHFVITKKYILSSGRLYALLRDIRNKKSLFEYGNLFAQYLDKYPSLSEFLLSDQFFVPFAQIIESDVFGSKRHEGKISFEETKKTREILVGNFSDQNSLFYQFLSSQGVGY